MRFAILTSLLLSFSAYAAEEIRSYPIRYRSADELKPIVGSLLAGKATVEVFQNKLIVNAEPAVHKRLEGLLKELDHKPRRLRISLRTDGETEATLSSRGARVRAKAGPVRVDAGGARAGDAAAQVGGAAMSAGEAGRESRGANSRSIEVLEGGEALIASGMTPFAGGMRVTPSLRGAGAHVKLEQLEAQGLNVQGLRTEIDMKLGEWVPVGSVREEFSAEEGAVLSSASGKGKKNNTVYIKVEKAE